MPTSDLRQIPSVLEEVLRLTPQTVLDVGAGWGKYGMLLREYLDEWGWTHRIDAIEPFPLYPEVSSAFKAYDNVFQVTIDEFKPAGELWEVALLVDVLEHFDMEQGYQIVEKLLSFVRFLVVVTPRDPSEQGAVYGNDLEIHRSRWQPWDFAPWEVVNFLPGLSADSLGVTLRGAV